MANDFETDDNDPGQRPESADSSKDPISSALKQVYNDVANEPVPAKLTDLLDQLKNGKTP